MTNAVYKSETSKIFSIIITKLVLSILLAILFVFSCYSGGSIIRRLDIDIPLLSIIMSIAFTVLDVVMYIGFFRLSRDMAGTRDGGSFSLLKVSALMGIIASAMSWLAFIPVKRDLAEFIPILCGLINLCSFILSLIAYGQLSKSVTFPGARGAKKCFIALLLNLVLILDLGVLAALLILPGTDYFRYGAFVVLFFLFSLGLSSLILYIIGWVQIKNAPLPDNEL